MTKEFETIGLIGKFGDPGVADSLHALGEHLHAHHRTVLLDEATAEVVPDCGLETVSREELGERCDLAIVIGGDGTLLNAARSLAAYDVALLGVNLGRLGFLTDISPAEMEQRLAEILAGEYMEEERFLLHCSILREGEHISESEAFNDVVVHKWDVARMIEVESYIDGQFVNTTRSDGLIVSSPTGSTAYALSGGGPILHPTLNAMVLVPICPHTMTNRPLVVDGDSTIELVVSAKGQPHSQVTCDGQINLGLFCGDRIVIRKKDRLVRLIHPVGHNHYEILRAKLSWG